MMGLAYIAAFAVYLLLSITVVKSTLNWARNNNKNTKVWGIVAGLVMYNLVFWDFLPTLALHKYYCAKESGFWVYKTAEQWRAEHPDVVVGPIQMPEGMVLGKNGNGEMILPDGTELIYTAEKQLPFGYNERSLSFDRKDRSYGSWLNDRIIEDIGQHKSRILDVDISDSSIIDAVTNEVLAKQVYVGSGNPNSIKIWTSFGTCGPAASKEIGKVWQAYSKLGVNIK